MTSSLELQSFSNCLLHGRVPVHHWSSLSSYQPGLSCAPLKRGQELVALGWFSLTQGVLSFPQRLPGPALSTQVPLKVWFLGLCSSHPTHYPSYVYYSLGSTGDMLVSKLGPLFLSCSLGFTSSPLVVTLMSSLASPKS